MKQEQLTTAGGATRPPFAYGDAVAFTIGGRALLGVCDGYDGRQRPTVVYINGEAWGALVLTSENSPRAVESEPERLQAYNCALVYCKRERGSIGRALRDNPDDATAREILNDVDTLAQFLSLQNKTN